MAWQSLGLLSAPSGADPLPSYAGSVTGRFDSAASLFNFKATNTRRMRAKLSKAVAGLDTCRIVWIGDSAPAGYGVTVGVQDHPSVVRRMLTGAGHRVGEIVQLDNNTSGGDARFSYGGSWSVGPHYYPYFQGASAAWISYTSSVPGTKVYIVCGDVPDSSFTYAIDGGAPVTVSPTGGPIATRIVEVSGLADTRHTVAITSGGISYLGALGVGYPTGIQLMNSGVSQSTAQDWQLSASSFGPNSLAAAVSPDVVFINVGANDYANDGTSVATIKGYLSSIIDQFGATADCILMVPSWPDRTGFAAYFQGLYEVAAARDIPLIDVSNALGDHAAGVAAGLFQADGLHLLPSGQAAVAALQFHALERAAVLAPEMKAFVPIVGDATAYGSWTLNGNLSLTADPSADAHAVRRGYLVAQLAGYATTSALTSGLSGKADTSALSSYATTSALTSGLAGKADTSALSSYATTSALTSGLAGKADTSALSSYATTSALTTGLAAKAADSAVVHKTGAETIAGSKTFTDQFTTDGGLYNGGWTYLEDVPTCNTAAVNVDHLVRKDYVDARAPRITTTQTVTYAATMIVDPRVGDNLKIAATGALALSMDNANAVDGQKILVEVYASGAARTVTIGNVLSTGITSTLAIASGKCGYIGFRYSSTLSVWVVLAATMSA